MRDVYAIVQRFFRDGPPASRNVAFEAYQDPHFARAVRIYQYLTSVRQHLLELLGEGEEIDLEVVDEGERIVLRVGYRRGQLRRTAFLQPEEWELLRVAPGLSGLFEGALPG